MPPALRAVLDADPDATAKFDSLAFTHRKEFAQWVAEARKDELATAESLRRSNA